MDGLQENIIMHSSMHNPPEMRKKAIIIGADLAGLAAEYILLIHADLQEGWNKRQRESTGW